MCSRVTGGFLDCYPMVESRALNVLIVYGWFSGLLSNDRVWSLQCVKPKSTENFAESDRE